MTFRYVNRVMVELWRLGLGRWVNIWPRCSGRILIPGHIGRRSGRRYLVPRSYAELDDVIYCAAGFGAGSEWYRNVMAGPHVEVWLPGRRVTGLVVDVDDHRERLRLLREVLLASGVAAPAAGLHPRLMDDEALAASTTGETPKPGYRLIDAGMAMTSRDR